MKVLVVLFVIFSCFLFAQCKQGDRFLDKYQSLKLDLSQNEVENIFKLKPDFVCKLNDKEVWYYKSNGVLVDKPDEIPAQTATVYQKVSQLPDFHAHVQMIFDHEKKLMLYTWCGETYTIVTREGEIEGSRFADYANKINDQ